MKNMMKNNMGGWLVATVAGLSIAAVLATVSCSGKTVEPFNDAPVGVQNKGPADGINFPDGFSNVSTKCDHGNRVYIAFHGDGAYAAIAVVARDPTCK